MIKSIFLKIYKDRIKECKNSILDLCEVNSNAKLLDLGCFDGEFTIEIAKKIKTKKVFGVEIITQAIKQAQKRGIVVKKRDLNFKLPFKSDSFDVIIANQVIEHLYNTDKFIIEIKRVLKPDGYAIISTNNLSSWHNIFSLLLGFQPFPSDVSRFTQIGKLIKLFSGDGGTFSHLRIFSYRALEEFIKHYGFIINSKKGIGYYPFSGIVERYFANFLDMKHCVYLTFKLYKI